MLLERSYQSTVYSPIFPFIKPQTIVIDWTVIAVTSRCRTQRISLQKDVHSVSISRWKCCFQNESICRYTFFLLKKHFFSSLLLFLMYIVHCISLFRLYETCKTAVWYPVLHNLPFSVSNVAFFTSSVVTALDL